jgi:hypothetical protein
MSILKIHEQQKEWAIKAAAGVAVSIFFFTTMVQPLFQDIVILRQGVMSSQKRYELYKEIQSLKESLANSEESLATLAERSQLLGRISDVAGRTQIRLSTLTPRTEPTGGFITLKMEMSGQGTFFSLLKFLKAIEKIGSMIKVKDLSTLWNPSSRYHENKDSLQIQLVLETLLKQRAKKNNA